jgi:excisionase family DNA binding protein
MNDAENLTAEILTELRAIRRLLSKQAAPTDEQPDLLTPAAAARALSVSTKTIRRMVAAGTLRSVPMGKRWRVPASEVRRVSAMRAPTARGAKRAPPADESPRDVFDAVLRRQRETPIARAAEE